MAGGVKLSNPDFGFYHCCADLLVCRFLWRHSRLGKQKPFSRHRYGPSLAGETKQEKAKPAPRIVPRALNRCSNFEMLAEEIAVGEFERPIEEELVYFDDMSDFNSNTTIH